jgi:hypothetical protein
MKRILVPSGILLFFLSSCVVPVNTSFERAATLGKGNVEAGGSFSHYTGIADGESESLHNNVGARIGFGVSDKMDLKIRYERIGDYYDYLSVVPKFSLSPKKTALLLPLSMYSASQSGKTYSIAPQFINTFTSKKNTADFSLSLKGDLLFSPATTDIYGNKIQSSTDFLVGFNAGAGISSNLDKWAIRPEIGYLFKPGDPGGALSFGVGFQFVIPHKNK